MKLASAALASLRVFHAVVAVLATMFAVGSSHAGIESPRLLAAIRHETPVAARVPASASWALAQAAALEIPGGRAFAGIGASMVPVFTAATSLVVAPREFAALRRGMTVVYRNSQGRLVAHALAAKMPQGWVAHGVGNDFEDDELVTAANLVGVVVAAYSEGDAQRANTF